MRKFFTYSLIFFILGGLTDYSSSSHQSLGLSTVLLGLKKALENMDGEAYSQYFLPERQEEERQNFDYFLKDKDINSIKVFPSRPIINGFQADVKLKVLFLQPTSVIIDIWDLHFKRQDDRWLIVTKEISPERKILYRLKIPAERVELAKTVEIRHADLEISFENAVCFYDNLPRLETALLIIGPGKFRFTPGVENERHYLKLMFGREDLVDELKYAYLRFSNSFFKNNIKIEPVSGDWTPPRSLLNKAYSLFARHYSRSFTVENSLISEFLSFIPQGEEVVFEFEGEKTGIMTYVFSPFAEEEVNLFQWRGDRIVNLYSPEEREGQKRMFVSFGRMFDIDAYKIEIDYNPEESYLSGKVSVKIIPLVESLGSLKFKFHQDLEVLKVYDQDKNELIFNRDRLRKIFYVYLLNSQKKGKPFYIDVFYRGKIKPEQLTSDVVNFPQYKDEIIFIPPKYETYLFSQSSYWYPSPPNDDYFQVELRAIFPPGYDCISNGELVEKGQVGMTERVEELEKIGHQYCSFKTRYPVKYISFIVGKFENLGQREERIPIAYYQASDTGFYRRNWLEEAERLVEFYSRVFGPFPYEKLYLVQRLWPQKGGHSPASFVIMNELPRFPGRNRLLKIHSPVDLSRWKGYFLAHEIAHQWWGQALSWETYHNQWLSEGMAQFASILYLKEKYGVKAYRQIIKNLTKAVNEKADIGPITMGSRLSFLDFEAYQTIVYNKSALALFMLKELVGEEEFFLRLRNFFNDYKYKAARTEDFFRYFKDLGSLPLAEFKKRWFDGYRLPVVYIYYSIDDDTDPVKLNIEVTQAQNWFPFPLKVKWEVEGREAVEVILVKERFAKISFSLTASPKKLKFNPWREIPGKFHIKKIS